MAKVRLKTTPRFWTIVLMVVCVSTCISIVAGSSALQCQRAKLNELRQKKEELELSNSQLRDRAEFAQTDEYIVQQARLKGMIGQNEIRYVLSTEGDISYAQGGN